MNLETINYELNHQRRANAERDINEVGCEEALARAMYVLERLVAFHWNYIDYYRRLPRAEKHPEYRYNMEMASTIAEALDILDESFPGVLLDPDE